MSPISASWPVGCFTAYAQTGESASIASSLPVTTALVASDCFWYWSTVILLDPHFLLRAAMSSTWTVPVCTATFLPQAVSGVMLEPVLAAHWVPAEKYDTIATCFSRAALTVNDETPT